MRRYGGRPCAVAVGARGARRSGRRVLGEERVDGEHPADVVGDLVEQQPVERVGGDVGQSRPAAPGHGGPLSGERLVADDDHLLGAERERGCDRRVQPRGAVDVVAGRAERRGHLDRREQQRDRRRRAHVLALQSRVDVLDLTVRARRLAPRSRRIRRACRARPTWRRRRRRGPAARRRWRAARPSRSSRRGCAPAATGSSSDAARSPGSSSTSPASRSSPSAGADPDHRRDHVALADRAPVVEEDVRLSRAGSAATAATTAALIPPTLVPHTISTCSPRAASAGMSTDSAPAS